MSSQVSIRTAQARRASRMSLLNSRQRASYQRGFYDGCGWRGVWVQARA